MDKLNCMTAFCEVVKAGSFSAGAKNLNVSKVLISRYVAQLEDDLGVRLLQRTTRKMSLTDEGSEYYHRCQVLLNAFDELENSTKDKYQGVHGQLRIAVPSQEFTCAHLIPFISQFSQQYPDVTLDINLADRYIDIVEEGYDLAVRIGKLDDSSLIAKKLSDAELVLCTSTEYLKKQARITHPKDLQQQKLIIDTNYRGGKSWKFTNQSKEHVIQPTGHIKLNSAMAVKRCLISGAGIGICPSFSVDKEIESGQLIRLLPEWKLMNLGIYVIFSHRNHLSPKVRAFITAISEHFAQQQ